MITTRSVAALLGVGVAQFAAGQTTARPDRFGDAMRFGLPAAAAAYSLYRDDTDGLKQLGLTWAASQIATEGLRQAVDSPRPTGTGHGFVSGHTSSAFASAVYLHRRYGLAPAAPAYVLATLTGYSRVDKGHHYTRQVLAGALVGAGSAVLLTTRMPDGAQLSIVPVTNGVALNYAARW